MRVIQTELKLNYTTAQQRSFNLSVKSGGSGSRKESICQIQNFFGLEVLFD